MAASDRLLNRAIQFSRQGNPADARSLLASVLMGDPANQAAWLWYADTFGSVEERLRVFETALRRCPEMPLVQRAYRLLLRTQETSAGNAAAAQAARERRAGRSPAWLVWVALILTGMSLVFGGAGLVQAYQIAQLSREKQSLQAISIRTRSELEQRTGDLLTLTGRYNGLQASYNNLEARHNQLAQDYQDLVARDQELQARFNTLNNDYRALSDKTSMLQSQYEALTKNFNDLQSISIVPPYISVRDRTVYLSFYKKDQSILNWVVPFDGLEADIERGVAARQAMYKTRNRIELNGEAGSTYNVVDFRNYVEPGTFRDVITDMYQQSPDEVTFLTEVWNIVAQLTTYSRDLGETPRFPLETLLAGGGDCEDTSILFASMVKAAPVDWKVSLVYMNSQHIHEVTAPNHVIVSVETGSGWYLVETTSKDNMLPYPDGVMGWYLEIQ